MIVKKENDILSKKIGERKNTPTMREKNFVRQLRKEILLDFKKNNRKGVYAKLQKMMAYNSNKIEGSTLTSEQTASLFDTGTIYAGENTVYRAKDIEEMSGHFLMFNHMLKTLDLPLSEKLIKEFHFYLKTGVFEDMANGYAVGQYKTRANIVSDIETSSPAMVAEKMKRLVEEYNKLEEYDIESLMRFHAEFERIHPFQDGNGRVGRMILFRECLKHDIFPIIIRDETKLEYYHVLHEAQVNENYELIATYARKQQELSIAELKPFIQSDKVLEDSPIADMLQDMKQ